MAEIKTRPMTADEFPDTMVVAEIPTSAPKPMPSQPLGAFRRASRWLRGDVPGKQYRAAVRKAAESDVDPNDALLPPSAMLIESRRYQRHFVADVRGYRAFQRALADIEAACEMREQADAMPRGDVDGTAGRTVLAAPGVFYVDGDKKARQEILSTAASIESDACAALVDLTVDQTADKRAALTAKREAAEAKLRTLETTCAWIRRRDELLKKLFDPNPDRLTPMARQEAEKALDTAEAQLSQRRNADTAVTDLETARQKVNDLDAKRAALAASRFEAPEYDWMRVVR